MWQRIQIISKISERARNVADRCDTCLIPPAGEQELDACRSLLRRKRTNPTATMSELRADQICTNELQADRHCLLRRKRTNPTATMSELRADRICTNELQADRP